MLTPASAFDEASAGGEVGIWQGGPGQREELSTSELGCSVCCVLYRGSFRL
jgi:hypothetical protein